MNHLLEAGRIGKLEVKNRVIMSAMSINTLVDVDGGVSDRVVDFYLERAKGGVGLIISGATRVEEKLEPPPESPWSPYLRLTSRRHQARLNTLVELLHDYDTKLFMQFTAGNGRSGRINPVVPSIVELPECHHSPVLKQPARIHRVLTSSNIKELVQDFGFAAKLAYDSGVDGIELHGHEGYLLDQFMTDLWNRRTDEYGGSTENRCRLACELIQTIKDVTNSGFPVVYQYGAEHKIPNGRTLSESVAIAGILEAAGADALRIDSGCYESHHFAHPTMYQPAGLNVDAASEIKKHVRIPVITVGKLGSPRLAEEIIREEKVDFVSLGRPLLADPYWVKKVCQKRIDDIKPCVYDNEGCHSRILFRKHLSCTVNPKTGLERYLGINAAKRVKKVFVIGGGPAGMEAARVLKLRGHNVELFERTNALGGLLNLISKLPFKKDMNDLNRYYVHQMNDLDVKIHLDYAVEEDIENIIEKKPDCVFVAVGSEPRRIEGNVIIVSGFSDRIMSFTEALRGERNTGQNIFVLGGGLVGCETALFLKSAKNSVTVIEQERDILREINWINRRHLMELLSEKCIHLSMNTEVLEIGDRIQLKRNSDVVKEEYDTLVVAIGSEPNHRIYSQLVNRVPEVCEIGDCRQPGMLKDAIWSAYRKARLI
jgi:2-enoate reductase